MDLKSVIANAGLWDHGTTAAHARRWVCGEGRSFLGLKASQVSGIENAVVRATNGWEYVGRLNTFLRDTAERQKQRSIWRTEVAGKTLLQLFWQGLCEALGAAERNKTPENAAFDSCCAWLSQNAPDAADSLREERQLAIVREYVSALVKCHRLGKPCEDGEPS